MCAILILGIALVGLTHGVATALSATKESEVQTTAALIAAGQIELLRAGEEVVDGATEGDCGKSLPLYRWRQTVTKADLEGLHKVEVVVENARTGKEIYSLETMLFEVPESSSSSSAPAAKGSRGASKSRSGRKGGAR